MLAGIVNLNEHTMIRKMMHKLCKKEKVVAFRMLRRRSRSESENISKLICVQKIRKQETIKKMRQ